MDCASHGSDNSMDVTAAIFSKAYEESKEGPGSDDDQQQQEDLIQVRAMIAPVWSGGRTGSPRALPVYEPPSFQSMVEDFLRAGDSELALGKLCAIESFLVTLERNERVVHCLPEFHAAVLAKRKASRKLMAKQERACAAGGGGGGGGGMSPLKPFALTRRLSESLASFTPPPMPSLGGFTLRKRSLSVGGQGDSGGGRSGGGGGGESDGIGKKGAGSTAAATARGLAGQLIDMKAKKKRSAVAAVGIEWDDSMHHAVSS
jgi:hypothetical protein